MTRSYLPKKSKENFPPCDVKGCTKDGSCRAPKDRTLREYYHFCPEHAAEYNKNWDYCKGMSVDDIEQAIREDVVWGRPSWAFGKGPAVNDPLNVLKDAGVNMGKKGASISAAADKKVINAMQILGIEPPLSKEKIRARYRDLAKQYHPDKTGGDKLAETKFKDISAAYKLLSKMV